MQINPGANDNRKERTLPVKAQSGGWVLPLLLGCWTVGALQHGDHHQPLPTGLGQEWAHLPRPGPGPRVRWKWRHYACWREPEPDMQDGASYSGCRAGGAAPWPPAPALSTQALPLPRLSAPRQGRVLNADPPPTAFTEALGAEQPRVGKPEPTRAHSSRERTCTESDIFGHVNPFN